MRRSTTLFLLVLTICAIFIFSSACHAKDIFFGASGGAKTNINYGLLEDSTKFLGLNVVPPASPLALTTYCAGTVGGAQANAITHPSVIYEPNGWNGHRWWMCATPYPNGDSQYENPCIYYSDDGLNWTNYASNPVIAAPGGGEYLSDPCIVLSPDKVKMYLFFKRDGGNGTIRVRESTDGFTFANEQTLLTVPATAGRYIAPTVLYYNGNWWMWTVDIIYSTYPTETSRTLTLRKATTVSGLAAATSRACLLPLPSGLYAWHPCVVQYKRYFHIFTSTSSLNNTGVYGYFGYSRDGENWTTRTDKTAIPNAGGGTWGANFYKASLVWNGSTYLCWYSASGSTAGHQIGLGTINLLDPKFDDNYATINQGAATTLAYPFAFGDFFQRADSTSVIGSADSSSYAPSAQVWTIASGTMGISGNALYASVSGNAKATVNPGLINCKISMQIKTVGPTAASEYLIFRYNSATSFFRVGRSGIDQVNGSVTSLVTWNPPIHNNCIIAVDIRDDTIKIYMDDLLVYSFTSAFNNTITTCGVQISSNTTTRIGSFTVLR